LPLSDNTTDIGSGSQQFKDLYISGSITSTSTEYVTTTDTQELKNKTLTNLQGSVILPDTNGSLDLGTNSNRFKDLFLTGDIISGATLTADGNGVFGGNLTLGGNLQVGGTISNPLNALVPFRDSDFNVLVKSVDNDVGSQLKNGTGFDNVLFGSNVGNNLTDGNNNCAFGYFALNENKIGSQNSTFGVSCMRFFLGNSSTAIGWAAMNCASATAVPSVDNNVAIGHSSMFVIQNSSKNCAIGSESLRFLLNGDENTAIGFQSGFDCNGNFNTFLGSRTDGPNPTNNSTAIGYSATVDLDNQIVLGNSQIVEIRGESNGQCNLGSTNKRFSTIFLGYDQTVSKKFININSNPGSFHVGNDSVDGYLEAKFDQDLGFGNQKFTIGRFEGNWALKFLDQANLSPGDNQAFFVTTDPGQGGTASTFSITNLNGVGVQLDNGQTSFSATSDKRLKKNLSELKDCATKLKDVKPYVYDLKTDSSNEGNRIGVVAQEIQQHFPQLVTKHKSKGGEETLGVKYAELVVPLLGALRELTARVETLEAQLSHRN
jgi:hypothetical protein